MEIKRLHALEAKLGLDVDLFALIGGDNPTGSIKDVTVHQMLLSYQKEGLLHAGSAIIEATSGNTGISLAYYQKEFDYHCIIVMPNTMSKQRRDLIAQYDGELVLVEGGMKECEAEAKKLASSLEDAFIFSQFASSYNPNAHYQVTGPLVYALLPDISYLFAGIGTGGTISGTSRYLKEKNSDVLAVGIEPLESPLLTKGEAHGHLIQGIGANFVPATLQREYVDDVVDVPGETSVAYAKLIHEVEGLSVGISSGAALLGAERYIKSHSIKKKKVLVIFPDRGDRYSW